MLLCTIKNQLGNTHAVEAGKKNQLLCYSRKSEWRKGTAFNLPYNTINLSYGKSKNINTIRCHESKVTTPRKGDQMSSTCNHAPNVLCSQTYCNQKDQENSLFLRVNYQSRLKKKNNTHLLTVETTHQVSSFQKLYGFLKLNSPLTPFGLLLQRHHRGQIAAGQVRPSSLTIPKSFQPPDCTQNRSVTSESKAPLKSRTFESSGQH